MSEEKSSLRAYLEQHPVPLELLGYPSIIERFVLRKGVELPGSELPKGMERGTIKACFRNATHMALEREGYVYHEGIAMSAIGFPTLHAWCVKDGKVIDTTWDHPEKCTYMGVPFDNDTIIMLLRKQGHYGFLDSGTGINVSLIYKLDPELEEIVNKIINVSKESFNL